MHITIFVYGTWGDMRPHVVLGMALQAAGHKVQVVAPQVYEEWVRARHLEFYPLKADINKLVSENAAVLESPLKQIQLVRKVLPPMMTQMGVDVLEATRNSDVLITVEFGAALLFDVLQVNHLKTILINPAPLNPTSEFSSALPPAPGWFPFPAWYNRFSYSVVERLQWTLLGGARNKLATQHFGLPKSQFKDFQALLAATPALTIVSQHVVQRPADWGDHWQVTGYLFDDDPKWTPPQELSDFLAAGAPPVYIGFGSMPDGKPEATTRTIIEAVQRTGQRAVILTGWAGLRADDVPANIHMLKYAPHSWLFPKMAAVVHHGGAGTTAAGFRAGVPTVIVPHNADQPYWGRRVKQLGLGADAIPRGKLNVDNLTQALQTVTTSSTIRENARALGEKIRQEDGLGTAMKWMDRFLA